MRVAHPGGLFGQATVQSSRPQSITSQSGWSVRYDNDGDLPLSETLAYAGQDVGSVVYEYDSLLRADRVRVNGTLSTTHAFDSDGLVVSGLLQTGSGSANVVVTRNATNGLPTTVAMGGLSTSYTQNAHGEELTRTTSFGASVLYATADVVRDDLGRITHEVRTVLGDQDELSYGYDGLGRLESVTVNGVQTSYTYDINGNRLTRTIGSSVESGQYNGADRVQTYGDYAYAFDGLGSLSTKTHAVSGAQTQYAYDVFGALHSVTLPNGTLVEYEIDAQGRRVGRRANGELARRWLYAGSRIVAELGAANEVVSRFMYVERDHVPDAMVRNGTAYRLITDVRGSVILVVNIATGTIAQQLEYDEFGRVLADTNPGFQPFGFAGGVWDADTGLVRFGARDYDAYAGRWTAPDPIRFWGGQSNLHAYAANDPINRIDPTGLFDFWGTAGKAWASGTTAIGVTLGNLGWLLGGEAPTIGNNAIEYRGNPLIAPFTPAITIGNSICYASSSPTARTQRHEKQHTYQAEALGPLYLPAHILSQAAGYGYSFFDDSHEYTNANDRVHSPANLLEAGPMSEPPTPW